MIALLLPLLLHAETGHDAWLRYAKLENTTLAIPAVLVAPKEAQTAADELQRGVLGMLGKHLRVVAKADEPAFLLELGGSSAEAFTIARDAKQNIHLTSGSSRGLIYAVSHLLRRFALHQPILNETQQPYAPLRWINHWDNLDGTIERGYGGRSLFFDANNVRDDLSAARDYARLLASMGINGIVVNNVNANPRVITPEFLPQLARLADVFRPWGIALAISVDFSSPQRAGGLPTFDPLDAQVVTFWKNKVDEIYRAVPDLGGFVIKADSEGRLGPSAYGRTHADAANVIADALAPHKGVLFYRGFVYDHHMDWRNLKNDRARAAYDNFIHLDGKFRDNVIVQIKHGPIDFQVREPASPLFGALEKTNQAIELQITQEYFGQGRYMTYLAPMWKEALDFDMQALPGKPTPVKALAAGKTFARPTGGFIGVANAGLNANWMRHHLSQANLYAFGRLAWNPDLTSEQIIDEWTRLTFSNDPVTVKTINALQLRSWRDFENYTGPLGTQTLTDISGNHYGPSVESSERNGWGQWHRADEKGIGMDRTVATGTGYIGQYRPGVAKIYENVATTPDELLLFMHHLPYTHKLRSGKTIIQHFYDAHYEGAEAAAGYVRQWQTLKGRVDEARYNDVLRDLIYQAGHAQVWRDAVAGWFLRTSGIPDASKRIGNYPNRHEAEAMQLEGYAPIDVKPWEGASGAKAVACSAATCTASFEYKGPAGWFTIATRYFDQNDGVASYQLHVNAQLLDHWKADDWVPTRGINSHSSSRRLTQGVALRPGDRIQITGTPQGPERAALDYIEILP